jgi:hypothetical protein
MVLNRRPKKPTVRVRLSRNGMGRGLLRGLEDRQGDGHFSNRYAYVRWDGCCSFQCYARDFIEEVTGATDKV